MLEKAIKIAAKAHKGQQDKGGEPYILHPLRLMLQCTNETDRIVAVLHDVVEDSPKYSFEKLRKKGASEEVLAALDALTRRVAEKEDYMLFIRRARANACARRVKRRDLKDNMDLSRISNPSAADLERAEKYRMALDLLDENE
ncbi:MAG: GTP pyrophosphokinase, partial [Deltaproteobacteria bacterium]|nr:GTP pyrophosphokinase [Deltaproteobacteria bacterium]